MIDLDLLIRTTCFASRFCCGGVAFILFNCVFVGCGVFVATGEVVVTFCDGVLCV